MHSTLHFDCALWSHHLKRNREEKYWQASMLVLISQGNKRGVTDVCEILSGIQEVNQQGLLVHFHDGKESTAWRQPVKLANVRL